MLVSERTTSEKRVPASFRHRSLTPLPPPFSSLCFYRRSHRIKRMFHWNQTRRYRSQHHWCYKTRQSESFEGFSVACQQPPESDLPTASFLSSPTPPGQECKLEERMIPTLVNTTTSPWFLSTQKITNWSIPPFLPSEVQQGSELGVSDSLEILNQSSPTEIQS